MLVEAIFRVDEIHGCAAGPGSDDHQAVAGFAGVECAAPSALEMRGADVQYPA